MKRGERESEGGPGHCPVNAGLYMAFSNIAFHLLPIWQQMLVANQFRIMPEIASKLLHTFI